MARSLRGRLAVALAAVAFLSVAVAAAITAGLVTRYAHSDAEADLRRMARAVAADPLGGDRARLGIVRRTLEINGDEMLVVFAGGRIEGLGAPELAAAIDATPLARGQEIGGTARAAGTEWVYVGIPIRGPAPRLAGVVLARPLRIARDVWGPVVGRVALAGIGAVLIAIAVSAWFARRLVRPVGELRAAARRIARGEVSQRVDVEGPEEIADLAASFNDMSAALEESHRREREFLASVSHELRTPLTAIRGYVEAIQDGAVRDAKGRDEALGIVHAEAGRLERLVQDVMDLARLGASEFRLSSRPCDLAETLSDAVAAHRAAAEEGGASLDADLPETLPADTDPDRVRQVVSNLVENALRVTPRGGAVRVRARADGARVTIEVSDTGPGIARDDLPHVFERSYLWRAVQGTRPVGTGLGLAIVRQLAEALGGTVDVASEVGAGSTFRVALPLRAPARDA